jgi:hypothetical protein
MTSQPPVEESVGLFAWILGSRRHASIAVATIAIVIAGAGVAIGRSASSNGSSSTPPVPPASPASPATPLTTPSIAPPTPCACPTNAPCPCLSPRTATHSPTSPPSPTIGLATQLAKTFHLALAQHTVHSVAQNVSKKQGTAVFDDYDGVKVGDQRISINGGHVEVRVIGSTTYLTGDTKGLAIYGITPQEVRALHGQWLPLVAGQAGYQTITAGVTISSTLQADRLSGTLTKDPAKTLDGKRVYGISGDGTGAGSPKGSHATMWISVQTGLPVEFDAANKSTKITETFEDWGKAIHVETPADVYGQPGIAS